MKTIRSKFIIAMLSLSVCITLILSVVSIRYTNKSATDTSLTTIKPLAMQVSDKFNATITRYSSLFEFCLNTDKYISASDDEQRLKVLREKYDENITEYCEFSLLDKDGKIIAADDEELSKTITGEQIQTALNNNGIFTTDIVKHNDKYYFSMLGLSKVKDGRELVACLTINTEMLNSVISDNKFSETGVAALVDSNGKFIIHSKNDYVKNEFNPIEKAKNDSEYKDYSKAFSKMLEQNDGSCLYTFNDNDYIMGYAQTDFFGCKIVLTAMRSDFTGASRSALYNIIIIGSVVLIITIIISVAFAKKITTPIVSATARIRTLAQGNLSDPVDVLYSKDELGILTHSLGETIESLRQYINLITVALTQINGGNLCHRIEGNFKGDFYKIKSTFNDILNALSDTFASINTAAEQVNTGAVQVSKSAQDLSQGSTQQASAIEELSATLNDVAKQIQQNSRDAKNAYNIVSENTDAIGSCNEDMTNMLAAMNAIHTSTAEIAKIIKVIDEISFQTNILALNAAVEAAREGSKGFGVVADEVRRLASRSAEAAKQTATLIENSTIAVSKGSQIAEETAKSLNKVVERSVEIQNLVKNITEASEDQANAIVQINTGVDQISAVVSANTSTAIEAASASEELSSQSLILKNMIARFKLTEDDDSDNAENKSSSAASRFDYDGEEQTEDEPVPKKSMFDYNAPDDDLESRLTETNDNDKY